MTSDLSAPSQWARTHHAQGPWPFLVHGFLELEGLLDPGQALHTSGPWARPAALTSLGL